MRAIIIDDKDSRALLDKLKLEAMEMRPMGQELAFCERHDISEGEYAGLVDYIHRRFHYEVCTWLQDQGCKVVR